MQIFTEGVIIYCLSLKLRNLSVRNFLNQIVCAVSVKMNIDKLYSEVVGDLGFQQILYCLFFSLLNTYSAFQMLQYKFVVRDTSEFLCYYSLEDETEMFVRNKCVTSIDSSNERYVIMN